MWTGTWHACKGFSDISGYYNTFSCVNKSGWLYDTAKSEFFWLKVLSPRVLGASLGAAELEVPAKEMKKHFFMGKKRKESLPSFTSASKQGHSSILLST